MWCRLGQLVTPSFLFFCSSSSSVRRRNTITAAAMTSTTTPPSPSNPALNRLVYGKNDALFGCIEELQNSKSFGSLLDAGTGLHSLRWIATLLRGDKGMADFTAITADDTMQRNVQMEAEALEISEHGQVIVGNWFDERHPLDRELRQKQYDTILADYLVGAMDGFSPYEQDLMIPKLSELLKPSGRLYIVGLQPIPDSVPGNDDANIVCKTRQVRDACILLAGHRCYREYPVDWVVRQIEKCPQLKLVDPPSRFPILYRHETVVKQINVARSKLPIFPNPELATAMATVLDDLERQSLEATTKNGRIQLGFDYVVAAERVAGANEEEKTEENE